MATTSTNYAGTCVDNGGGDGWTNPTNAQGAINATYADGLVVSITLNQGGFGESGYLKCTNFGFSSSDVPAGATINGITVTVTMHSTNSTLAFDYHVYLVKGGTIMTSTTDKGTSTAPGTIDITRTYGGSADLWGNTLTQSDVIASTFGVAIDAGHLANIVSKHLFVDAVGITINYTAAAASNPRLKCLLGVGR